jgi:dUTP pyrophosphatase
MRSQIHEVQVKKLHAEATLPTRAHADDAGMDLYSLEDLTLEPQKGAMSRTGIAFALPERHVGMIVDRSSMAKKGIKIAGGIIDAGYRGEVHIVLWNLSSETVVMKKGERIAQMMIVPIETPKVVEVSELGQTARGAKGFGSSGK